MNLTTRNPSLSFRRISALLALAVLAVAGIGATSASAHTFSATGKCGVANLKWVSFAGSGSKPANKPDWKIVKDNTQPPVASGQASFTGTSGSVDATIPSTNGSYVASSSWTAANTRDGDAASGQSTFTLKGCNTISTIASPGVTVGGAISDTAKLAGVTGDAKGSIKFELFADTDTKCVTPITSSTTPVSGNGDYKSADYTSTTAGGYQWTATYSGDAKNDPIGPHGCGVPEEHVTVTTPPVVTPPTPTPPTTTPPTTTPPTTTPPATNPPGGGVKNKCRVLNGRLKLTGPSGNVRRAFKLKVHTRGYSRLSVFVDGRKVKSIRNKSLKKKTYSVRINPMRMNAGVHRIRVIAGTGPARCKTTKRGLSFVRAAKAETAPNFTG